MQFTDPWRERSTHHQPHDHFPAVEAAQGGTLVVRHLGQALGVLLDQLEETEIPTRCS